MVKKRTGKKKSFHIGKVQINFTNKLAYTILSVMILILAGVVVFAVDPTQPWHPWSQIDGIPADLADGAISWGEIGGIPTGFADGVDDDTKCNVEGDCDTICLGDGSGACRGDWPTLINDIPNGFCIIADGANGACPGGYLSDIFSGRNLCCKAECTDGDGDEYTEQGGACGTWDCLDTNANVKPGQTEYFYGDANGGDYDCSDGVSKTWGPELGRYAVFGPNCYSNVRDVFNYGCGTSLNEGQDLEWFIDDVAQTAGDKCSDFNTGSDFTGYVPVYCR